MKGLGVVSIQSPCKGCQERYPACHDSCQRYIDAKSEFEETKQRIHDAQQSDKAYLDYKLGKIAHERKQGANSGRNYKFKNLMY